MKIIDERDSSPRRDCSHKTLPRLEQGPVFRRGGGLADPPAGAGIRTLLVHLHGSPARGAVDAYLGDPE
jgi:hypothetical protein